MFLAPRATPDLPGAPRRSQRPTWTTTGRRLLRLVTTTALAGAVLAAAVAAPGAVGLASTATTAPDSAITSTYAAHHHSGVNRLIIRSLGIDAHIVPISLGPNSSLTPPSHYTDVGWWNKSALPGAPTGQTVITGHSVHTGGGAMNNLPRLRRGHLQVVTPAGSEHYRVTKVIVLSHDQLSHYARRLFGQGRHYWGGSRLVLITCTDYDGYEWRRNFVAFAHPLGRTH